MKEVERASIGEYAAGIDAIGSTVQHQARTAVNSVAKNP